MAPETDKPGKHQGLEGNNPPELQGVTVVTHPLLDHSMTILRDKQTGTEEFRRNAGLVSTILMLEATKNLTLSPKTIDTPLAPFKGGELSDQVFVVPILRAGLAMLRAFEDFYPNAAVGFNGLQRDESTAIAQQYYQKFPKLLKNHLVLVVDPMLATGGSFERTLTDLKAKGAERLVAVSIVSARPGIARVTKSHPDVHIYTAAIDEDLNDKSYIVPGLGDFGDRYYGTQELS